MSDSREVRCRINLLGFKNNENHEKLNNRDLNQAHDYKLGMRNLIEFLISTFQSRSVLECSSRGKKYLGSRLKLSLVTEGHLLIIYYVSFLYSRDYLQVSNEMNRVFGKYCGHMTGKTLLVSGKYALIKFHSESRIQNRRFLISFTSCKKEYFNEVHALIIVIITLKCAKTQKVDNAQTIIKPKLKKTSS